MYSDLLARLNDALRRLARLEAQESLPKTEALLTTGANTGATAQAQAFTYPIIAPSFDAPLSSAVEADYFNQFAATTPTGWTQVTAAVGSNTNSVRGFWTLWGSSSSPAWKYRERAAALSQTTSIDFGPIFWRDPVYTADVTYTFGLYRDNGSGTIDETRYNTVQLNYSASLNVWRVRSVMRGTVSGVDTTYTSDYQVLPVPLVQRLFVRVTTTISNDNKRAHYGQNANPVTHTTLDNRTLVIAWNTPWIQISMERGSGINDYLYLGGIDRTANL